MEPENNCYMCGDRHFIYFIRRYCRHCGHIKYWVACQKHGDEFRASHDVQYEKDPLRTAMCPDCKERCPYNEFWVIFQNKGE